MPSKHRPWFASILITVTLAAYAYMPSHDSIVSRTLGTTASDHLQQQSFDRQELAQTTQMLTALRSWLDHNDFVLSFQKMLQ